MAETQKVRIIGRVTLKDPKTGETIYSEHNAIGEKAIEVLAQCLTQLGGERSVSMIRATGNGISAETNITGSDYTVETNTITFRALFGHDSFSGDVGTLELWSGNLLKMVASKSGLNINKDAQSSLLVEWAITVQQA